MRLPEGTVVVVGGRRGVVAGRKRAITGGILVPVKITQDPSLGGHLNGLTFEFPLRQIEVVREHR